MSMIQKPDPVTLSSLTERIEKLSGGRLSSTISNAADTLINSIAPLEFAGEGDVSFLASPKYREQAKQCKATALVLTVDDKKAIWGDENPNRICVITRNPYAWFALALQVLLPATKIESGIDPKATIDPSAQVDSTARIEAGVVIGARAKIGANVHIMANTVIGEDVVVGQDSKFYPNVNIYHGCRIGERNIIHSGAVLGADGFGFAPLDGIYIKIPQIGIVETGNDVEIGANTCIDRGALNNTVIGKGTKIDDHVMIGHNCRIGANVVVSGMVGMAGSTVVGDSCQIAGGAGLAGHLTIAAGSIIGADASVKGSLEKPGYYAGFFPVMPHKEAYNTITVLKHLPEMRRQLKQLTLKVDSLKKEE